MTVARATLDPNPIPRYAGSVLRRIYRRLRGFPSLAERLAPYSLR